MSSWSRLRKTFEGSSFVMLAVVCCAVAATAQAPAPTASLTAGEVIQRLTEMNAARAKALEAYSGVRTYHLECHCVSHKEADMVIRVEYHAPDTKEFTVVSESGSGSVRNRVFKKLLEAEQESMQEENQERSAITPENYAFQLSGYEKTDAGEFYVLDAEPRSKNKFLFRGRIWVDAKEFAIARVEGEPAVNPSWWTVKTEFKRRYQKIGNFWLPESNESETKVRVFGTAVLTIEYSDYKITQAPDETLAFSPTMPSAAR